jgi:hypothetical protein
VMQSIALLLPLLLLVTPAMAHATNEGSCRYGFNNAVSDYESCYQGLSSGDCNVSNDDAFSEWYVGAGPGNVTNQTVYVHNSSTLYRLEKHDHISHYNYM